VKVIIDENLSPALARALNALFDGEHQVVHIRDKFGPSVKDVDWIGGLSAEGRWIIISGDANIARKKAEQAAFRNSRLIGFFLAHALNASKITKQMQRLLALWEDIETVAVRVAGGAMYELPIKGKIRQLRS
jgi:predicted nuclease of predicted toxin-antitoxin system